MALRAMRNVCIICSISSMYFSATNAIFWLLTKTSYWDWHRILWSHMKNNKKSYTVPYRNQRIFLSKLHTSNCIVRWLLLHYSMSSIYFNIYVYWQKLFTGLAQNRILWNHLKTKLAQFRTEIAVTFEADYVFHIVLFDGFYCIVQWLLFTLT
jgi:hypothetical protein